MSAKSEYIVSLEEQLALLKARQEECPKDNTFDFVKLSHEITSVAAKLDKARLG